MSKQIPKVSATQKKPQFQKSSIDDFEFFCGDAAKVLRSLDAGTVDMCITSPPYWGQREYDSHGIGLEHDFKTYISNLCEIMVEVKRVLKPQGSIWLNLGDSYDGKNLIGIPWRVALTLVDQHKMILRNDVIWNKLKGSPDNSNDKLRNLHEHVFHFVKQKKYFYDADAIRQKPREATIVNGSVVSATGVSGIRYRRHIQLSTALSDREKAMALEALDMILDQVRQGKISDFRMIVRGQHRTTHSNSTTVSGRARELVEKGFYFLKYHPNGSKPSDVWSIIPEDKQRRDGHFAPFPEDLCRIPILATSPKGGIVLDPFCGTGTSLAVAKFLGRKGIGIDISKNYIALTKRRLSTIQPCL